MATVTSWTLIKTFSAASADVANGEALFTPGKEGSIGEMVVHTDGNSNPPTIWVVELANDGTVVMAEQVVFTAGVRRTARDNASGDYISERKEVKLTRMPAFSAKQAGAQGDGSRLIVLCTVLGVGNTTVDVYWRVWHPDGP